MSTSTQSALPDDFALFEGAYAETLAACESFLESDPEACIPPTEDHVRAAFYVAKTNSYESSSYRFAWGILASAHFSGGLDTMVPDVALRVSEFLDRMPTGNA